MSYRKIWFLALAALFFSGFLIHANLFISNQRLLYNATEPTISHRWQLSDGEKTLSSSAVFKQVGSLKNQVKVMLTKNLPDTTEKSLCFVTIGYAVKAWIDGKECYTFGSSLDSKEVWGVKTHIFNLPDGKEGRELQLEFLTNTPRNIAVSKYILLDDTTEIMKALLQSDFVKIVFALLYIFIGIFMLLLMLVSKAFKRFNLSILMLASIALLFGMAILFNISILAFHAGPVLVYWIVNLTVLAHPIATLLFVAVDKGFKKSRLILVTSMLQGIFITSWVICNLFKIDFFLVYWHMPLSAFMSFILIVTFASEFKSGKGRPEIALSVLAILLASSVDAYGFFVNGNHSMMDFSLVILTFPILVLMIGKVALSSVQREYHIMNENMTLRIEGALLYKNYHQMEKYMEETKLIWHDIDKHFALISSLTGKGDYDELKHYLQHVGYEMKKTKSAWLCENRLINVILTDKLSEAQDKGIEVHFTGDLPQHLHIQGNDLCSLLVNMLDNAIEACEKISDTKERTLYVSIGLKNDFVFFSISNSSATAPVMAGEAFITSKEDTKKHGYGIAIIQRIVRKYDGAFDVSSTENMFLAKVALKNAPMSKIL